MPEKIQHRRAAAQDFFNRDCVDRAAVIAALDKMNLAWGDVRPPEKITQQPTVQHRGSITQVDDGAGGQRPITQSPYRFSGAHAGVKGRAPHQGEHNAQVLEDWLALSQSAQAEFADALVDVKRA